MSLTDIPCLLMRGGTSRAPFFKAGDLPQNRDDLAKVLIALMGAGSPLQTDGIGGGQPTTSKVAMLSASDHEWADIDFFFAQVHHEREEVDFAPSCGNILSGVGPAAIEMGLIEAETDKTSVKIRSLNTGALTEADVETPDHRVNYAGDARIDGIPGTAAPVILNFMDVIGSKTGKLFPTGNPIDVIDGMEVTCIDVAVPMVIGRAEDFGITGYEDRTELDENRALLDRFERLRLQAGERMGLGDVSKSVVPRWALLSPPRSGGAVNGRYFTPWTAHPSFAVTGSICTGSCLLAPGTVAQGLTDLPAGNPAPIRPTPIRIEHVSGAIDVIFDYSVEDGVFDLKSAGLLRTARRLFKGEVSIPAEIWAG